MTTASSAQEVIPAEPEREPDPDANPTGPNPDAAPRPPGDGAEAPLVRLYAFLTRGTWKARWRALTITLWVVISVGLLGLLGPPASLDNQIVPLELAGSATRAAEVLQGTSLKALHAAVIADIWFILGYAAVLLAGLTLFPLRAYRLQGWRSFRHTATAILLTAVALDVVENVLLLIASGGTGTASNGLWVAVASAAWAKFLGLAVVLAYVVNAACIYALTPQKIQALLAKAEDASVEPNEETTTMPAAQSDFRQGICIAGGGVRSAALALGGLQELESAPSPAPVPPAPTLPPAPSWDGAARISAVSGGAYMAGAWSIARSTKKENGGAHQGAQPAPWAKDSPEEQHLMTRLGYLLAENPTGQPQARRGEARVRRGDVPGVILTYLSGVVLNVAVLLTLWWLVVQPWAWLLQSNLVCGGPRCTSVDHLLGPLAVYGGASLAVAAIWVLVGWVKALPPQTGRIYKALDWLYTRGRPAVTGALALTIGYAVAVLLVPLAQTLLPGAADWLVQHIEWGAVLSAIGAVLAAARTASRETARLAPIVGGVLLLVTALLVTVAFVNHAGLGPDGRLGLPQGLLTWLVVLVIAAVLFLLVSPEWWSMASFYRGKLRLAFATRRTANGVEAYPNGRTSEGVAEPRLSEYQLRDQGHPDGSPLRICATATTSSRRVFTHYGLPALGVTLTPEKVTVHVPVSDEGHYRCYSCPPADIERMLDRPSGLRLTTMAAVGMSGAAISPAMGRYRIGPTRSLIALLNARLGVWIPNPKYVSKMSDTLAQQDGIVHYPNRRIGYLLKEFLGIFDPDDLYLYLTDGGHWENTGLVELLREGMLDEVVCLDADTKVSTLRQLADAVVLAKLEIGAEIKIDLDDLRRSPGTPGRGADYAKRSVAVGIVQAEADGADRATPQIGLLWYAKPVLTSKTPADLLAYAETDPSFPTTSTLDQFFHTAQFTAYRDLGRYNARELLAARTALLTEVHRSPDLEALRRESDKHWSIRSLLKLVNEEQYGRLREVLAKDPLP